MDLDGAVDQRLTGISGSRTNSPMVASSAASVSPSRITIAGSCHRLARHGLDKVCAFVVGGIHAPAHRKTAQSLHGIGLEQ